MKASNHDELRRLIGVVEAARADIPALTTTPLADLATRPKSPHRRACEKIFHRLASREHAEIRETMDGTQVILAGIKARSRRGPDAALCNWQRAAKLKLKMENGNG